MSEKRGIAEAWAAMGSQANSRFLVDRFSIRWLLCSFVV